MASAPRSGWDNRKPGYRSRLIGAGRSGKLSGTPMSPSETQRYWERGGDLRGGRSHRPTPKGSAPRQATERESVGMGDAKTYKDLERWRKRSTAKGGPPAWLRGNEGVFSTDTAAILSQIDVPPSRWRSVEVEYLPNGSVIVRIQPKGRAYQRVVVFPDSTGAHELLSVLRSPGANAANVTERKRLQQQWGSRPIEVKKPINSPGAKKRRAVAA